jgi:hypothetical protein
MGHGAQNKLGRRKTHRHSGIVNPSDDPSKDGATVGRGIARSERSFPKLDYSKMKHYTPPLNTLMNPPVSSLSGLTNDYYQKYGPSSGYHRRGW